MRNVIVHTERVAMDSWQAKLDSWEPGDPIGYGDTEADAVYDLYCDIDDHEWADEQQRMDFELGPQS